MFQVIRVLHRLTVTMVTMNSVLVVKTMKQHFVGNARSGSAD